MVDGCFWSLSYAKRLRTSLSRLTRLFATETYADLVLLDLLGLAIAATLALVVGEVAVLAVRHRLLSPHCKKRSHYTSIKKKSFALGTIEIVLASLETSGHNNQNGLA